MKTIFRHGNTIFKHSNQIFYRTEVNPDMIYKAYGVIYDENNSDTNLQRIGNLAKHASLPVQSAMRRCLLNDDGTVNYYLDADDSTLKAGGGSATLDGSDGQVMVEIPAHWQFFAQDGSKHYAYISDEAIDGFTYVPKSYYGAFFATVDGSNVMQSRSGVVAKTNVSRTTFRAYARARGDWHWNIDNYYQRKILFWLYLIEYAQSNSQADIDNTLTVEGYRKGGLGIGVTTYWPGSNQPYVLNGKTLSLGNHTGQIVYTYTGGYPITVNSYRGIEMPFGHVYSWTDGVQAIGSGGKNQLWTSDKPEYWNDIDFTTYVFQGNLVGGGAEYIRNIIGNGNYLGRDGNVAGSYSTYLCDTNTGNTGTSIRGLLSGGSANSGAAAGLAYAYSFNAPSLAAAYIGSRLCYIP